MIWPLDFAPQRCSECGERFPISRLQPIQTDDEKLAGWCCLRCDGETELVECAPDVGTAPTQLRLPAYDTDYDRQHWSWVDVVRVQGGYL